jgi:hypothetical protein
MYVVGTELSFGKPFLYRRSSFQGLILRCLFDFLTESPNRFFMDVIEQDEIDKEDCIMVEKLFHRNR